MLMSKKIEEKNFVTCDFERLSFTSVRKFVVVNSRKWTKYTVGAWNAPPYLRAELCLKTSGAGCFNFIATRGVYEFTIASQIFSAREINSPTFA